MVQPAGEPELRFSPFFAGKFALTLAHPPKLSPYSHPSARPPWRACFGMSAPFMFAVMKTYQAIHSEIREAGHVAGQHEALFAAISLSDADGVPEWVHLLPAGEIKTRDGRGPYYVTDMKALAAVSLQDGEKLVIDENHATDLAAPEGRSAPARGWIVALEARSDGLWGQVEWTEAGRRMVESREYRGISPNMKLDRNSNLLAIQRASLVNAPNLRGLAALHQEEKTMDFMAKLRKALNLSDDTGENDILAAVDTGSTALQAAEKAKGDAETALQSALTPIAQAVGLDDGAAADQVLASVKTLKDAGGDSSTVIASLQSELTTVTTKLNAITETSAKDKATAFIDGAIENGHVGVKPLRDHYIARHMKEPDAVEQEINAMPKLNGDTVIPSATPNADGEVSLNAEQKAAAKLLGVAEDDYRETLNAEQQAKEAR